MNIVHLIGNLGRDPEIRTTATGMKIATFPLATSKCWKDKATGEKKEHTEWHRIAIMSDTLSGVVENYVKKGSKLAITGELRTNKWTHRDGTDRYTTEVIVGTFGGSIEFLDKKDSGGSPPTAGSDLDDEIPF